MFNSILKLSNNHKLVVWFHLALELSNLIIFILLLINMIHPLSFIVIIWSTITRDHLIWSSLSGIILFLGFINVYIFSDFDNNSILNTLHSSDLTSLARGVGLLIALSIVSLILSFVPWSTTVSLMSDIALGLFLTICLQAHLLVDALYYSTAGNMIYQLKSIQKHRDRKQHTMDMIQRIYDGVHSM